MAGNSFRRLWSWLSIAIVLSGCSFLPSGERLPCTSYFSDGTRDYRHRSEAEVTIFLRERCEEEVNTTEIQDFLDRSAFGLEIAMMPTSLTCETQSRGLDALLRVLGQRRTAALVAALDSPMCEIAVKLARLWNVSLLTWTCPMMDFSRDFPSQLSSIVRLTPSLPLMAKALAQIFARLQWKTVVVVGTDREPWSSLERELVHALRNVGTVLRYRAILPYHASLEEIRKLLRPAHTVPRKATVLCLPTRNDDESTARVLGELDIARQAANSPSNSMIVMLHAEDDDLFLPRNNYSDSPPDSFVFPPRTSSMSSNFSTLNESYYETLSMETLPNFDEGDKKEKQDAMGEAEYQQRHVETDQGRRYLSRRFLPPEGLSSLILDSLLAITPVDQRYDVEKMYDGTDDFVMPTLLDRLNETLNVLTRDNGSINSFGNKMYTYALLDWHVDVWRPIMMAVEQGEELVIRKLYANAPAFRGASGPDIAECDVDTDCEANVSKEPPYRTTHIVAIVLGSLMLTSLVVVIVILIRKRLLKKSISKGPYKIILTTSDFVFPQVPQVDSRRVGEGIETMLCCWLQQLQEFGGPEVEKPDLLQLGSVSSLRPYLQASTGNLTRHTFFKDPRARYNGDLVQLKELPCQGTFELKKKAMDVLVTIHGLRHENLNPLIGCLNEPTRPCLVYEYCSRGSLEDVLVQDEIKLDWSFRLSLLTDLVRGMRYIHGTPIRVHGYLTSRNCVIDARWVLKVTDYGLPTFYEAQNILPPAKTARDLLWTAPELLRQPNLRKKGTQPGDVYSFGIIMQEVVVRGEPFCMLALSPEDIIEKVIRPPPLIRPSVSKGAAPPEAINIMRQCWAEAADMRPDFDDVHDLFKKLNHGRKVNFVDTMFQMLEKYSNNLEELIRERTEQLDMEKKKTEQLLNRMLPSSVAEKLKIGMPVDPEEFREVTIYFSDIVGFTAISAHSTPFQVVDLLNDLYTCFDATINAYTVYKVETIGDAYMVVGGCPVRIPDHASQIATMALDLLHQSGKFKLKHLPRTQLRLRIGLHTGPCCAGVVGLTMPRYCLFGDTVNTASRMESTGAPWRIHLSQATRDRLNQVGGYRIEYRGRTDVKGKGKMPTYWLLGKQGFDKELPTPPSLGFLILLSVAILPPSPGRAMGKLTESLIVENLVNQEAAEATWDASGGRTFLQSDEEVGSQVATVESVNGATTEDKENEQFCSGVEESATGRKIAVSVHEEVAVDLCPSPKLTNKKVPTADVSSTREGIVTPGVDHVSVATVTKSTSGDTQVSLGVCSISCVDAAATGCVLGASTGSLASISSSTTLPYRPAPTRHRRLAGFIDENDLSSPYNHYRCLSPNEHYGRSTSCRLLKRQFSLDRADEPVSIAFTEQQHNQPQQQQQQNLRATPRLYKQNSAGAATDLERIEEVPSTPGPLQQSYRHAASVSLSVESLTLR